MARNQPPSLTGPVAQTNGLARLQGIVETGITDDDLKEIVTTFKDKAKSGHEPSARFVIDYLLGAKQTPQTVVVNQFFEGDSVSGEALAAGSSPRRITSTTEGRSPLEKITVYLSASGAAIPSLIANETGLDETTVIRELDNHPERFIAKGREYRLKTVRAC